MTATISFKIRTIKHQIQVCLQAIKNGLKSFVDRLCVLEAQLESMIMTPEQEYLLAIQKNIEANQTNHNGEFFWGFSSETAENQVVEICQKHKCKPSQELIQIAYNSINCGTKGFMSTLENNIKKHLSHLERMAKWEKEAEPKWVEAEKEHDSSPVTKIMTEIQNNGFSASLWEKHGKTRIYIHDCFGSDCGYVDLTDKPVFCLNDGGIVQAIVENILGV